MRIQVLRPNALLQNMDARDSDSHFDDGCASPEVVNHLNGKAIEGISSFVVERVSGDLFIFVWT